MGAEVDVDCCIAGAGPAGAVLALLLARAGLRVTLLEKHGDFLRDFRGDTLHPSTLQIMDELGLADELLQLPHSRVSRFEVPTSAGPVAVLDLTRLRTRFPFIAFMPQWDFLTFVVSHAGRYLGFQLLMNAEATGLLTDSGGGVTGVRYTDTSGEHTMHSTLVVAADGRHSALRAAAGLPSRHTSPPVDVLWFRLSRRTEDPDVLFARAGAGQFLVFLYRGDYWQVGAAIPKGRLPTMQARGIQAFRAAMAAAAPDFTDRLDEIRGWEDVKLLEVRADRLRRWWRPGLLCIGDAAHAMSPVGGIGINFAVQDAVVAANRLVQPLRRGWVSDADLRSVQRARQLPTAIVQSFQSLAQRGMMLMLARSTRPVRPRRSSGSFPVSHCSGHCPHASSRSDSSQSTSQHQTPPLPVGSACLRNETGFGAWQRTVWAPPESRAATAV